MRTDKPWPRGRWRTFKDESTDRPVTEGQYRNIPSSILIIRRGEEGKAAIEIEIHMSIKIVTPAPPIYSSTPAPLRGSVDSFPGPDFTVFGSSRTRPVSLLRGNGGVESGFGTREEDARKKRGPVVAGNKFHDRYISVRLSLYHFSSGLDT